MAEHPLFQRVERHRRRTGKVRDSIVTMAHGGGGKASHGGKPGKGKGKKRGR